jgi:hypothetical protein
MIICLWELAKTIRTLNKRPIPEATGQDPIPSMCLASYGPKEFGRFHSVARSGQESIAQGLPRVYPGFTQGLPGVYPGFTLGNSPRPN